MSLYNTLGELKIDCSTAVVDNAFTYTQAIANATWIFTNQLATDEIIIEVWDNSSPRVQIFPTITVSSTIITLTFSVAYAGIAVVMGAVNTILPSGIWARETNANLNGIKYSAFSDAMTALTNRGSGQIILGKGVMECAQEYQRVTGGILGSGIDDSILRDTTDGFGLIAYDLAGNPATCTWNHFSIETTLVASTVYACWATNGSLVYANYVKFRAQTGTNSNIAFWANSGGSGHALYNCTFAATGGAASNYGVYVSDGDGVSLFHCFIVGDIYVSNGSVTLYDCAVFGNVTVTGASSTVTINGGTITGNVTQASSGTLNLREPTVTGTRTGTYTGSYFDANGHLKTGDYTSWSPTITQTGAVTATVSVARYKVINDMAHVEVRLVVTGAGTGGTTIVIGGFPSAIYIKEFVSGLNPVGTFSIYDSGTALYYGFIQDNNATNSVVLIDSVTRAACGVNPNFALAAGDYITLNMNYRVA